MMSEERELLKKILATGWLNNTISCEVEELLAQPEQDQAGAVMPNGVCVSNVYDAYEEGRKSVMVEQEPVGYLYKQMDCYGEWATIFKVDKPYITWHDIKDIVPVYTAPPKPEQDNIQYLLDQVARLTAENAMLKEKWSTSKQPEQEPVAWMYDHQIEVDYDKYTGVNFVETCARNLESNNCINIRPLYLAPPKQEPLSDGEITDLWANKSPANEFECVRLVEKAHGIGGGNE
jgi:hypothetical protein